MNIFKNKKITICSLITGLSLLISTNVKAPKLENNYRALKGFEKNKKIEEMKDNQQEL